ncbi:hypothetical protein K438DRAFT_1821476 [Mycena galopus ATCC 62051]|nr:hypothetical protein K438DRAFT_1821476 [Mycena galopus ATCC 62051]
MNSPFAQHLGSNYPSRRGAEKALDELTEERDTLKGYVDAHQALMSPIRRVPLDTIEDIFMACLPAHRNCVMSAQEAPSYILSQPQLWSRLHIVEPTVLPDPLVAQRLEMTTAWLRRSGDCPLSISLESHPNWYSDSPRNTESFIKALIPFSSRWRNIRLAVQSFTLEPLTRLTENDDQVPFMPKPGGVLHGPSLTRFSLFSGRNDNCLDLPLQWNQLTSLILFPSSSLSSSSSWDAGHLQTPQVVLDILSTCPKLQICMFLVHDSVDGFVADDIVECPSLRSVDILCLGGQPLHTAQLIGFSLAAFPLLNSIVIDTETFTQASLMDFVSALPPTIRSLRITEPTDPWQLASSAPVLDDEVLVTLAAHCPALRELIIFNCRHVTDDALLRFIISGIPTLRRVQIKFERERQVDIRPSIQPFVDNGLECNAMYMSPPPPPPRSSPWEGLPDVSELNFQSFSVQ